MKKKIYSTILLTICFFTESIQAQNITKFRFAQLTDTHLSVTNPARTEDLLRTIAHINATDSIDFVLASGDLTNEGDKTSLELVKSCLDLLKVPYYVIPGNHETKWSSSACTAFTEVFGYERFSFDHKGIFFIGFNRLKFWEQSNCIVFKCEIPTYGAFGTAHYLFEVNHFGVSYRNC